MRLPVENGGNQKGDKGLKQLNLADMGDAAEGQAGIPGEKAEILAHESHIDEADPTPGGIAMRAPPAWPRAARGMVTGKATTSTQEITSQPARPRRTSLPEST